LARGRVVDDRRAPGWFFYGVTRVSAAHRLTYRPTILLLLGGIFVAAPAVADIGVRDDTGVAVTLAAPARRVIALAPHAVELLYAAGAGARLVAAVEFSDYPDAARALPRVGDSAGLDLERIVALKPDLIVAWASGNPRRMIERLRALGIPVYLSEPRRLAGIASNIERLGILTGDAASARAYAARFTRQYRELATRYQGAVPVRVFYQVLDPAIVTVNGDHLISEVGRLCGGRNVFETLPKLDPVLDPEAVLHADPEAIIASGLEQSWARWRERWRAHNEMTAVRRGALYFIPADILHRQSPRILEGAKRLCADLDDARRSAR